MIRAAFNMAHRLHSRPMQIRRPQVGGDMYQTGRVAASSYFRFLSGPASTIVPRREFIVSADSLTGEFSQLLKFDSVPTGGTFQLSYNGNPTTDLNFDIDAATLQTTLKLLAGLANILVTGDSTLGFTITFRGFGTQPIDIIPQNFGTLVDMAVNPVTPSISDTYTAWAKPFQIGDKIAHPEIGQVVAADIEILVDLGGAPLGWRVRTE